MANSKLILHWLAQSRAQRIVWLLEELEVEYDVKIYHRTAAYRAPPELLKLHPLGRSPVLEVITNGKSRFLAESGHIMQYLLDKYDTPGKLTPANEDDKEEVDFYLHYAEGSLQPDLVALFVNNVSKRRAPWGFQYLTAMVVGALNKGYYEPHALANLDFLETKLKAQHEAGSKYLVGHKLSGADIILYFPIYSGIFSDPVRAKSQFSTVESIADRFPHLSEWSEEVVNEAKLIKANEVIAAHDKDAKL